MVRCDFANWKWEILNTVCYRGFCEGKCCEMAWYEGKEDKIVMLGVSYFD
jgi:hypothetical protein